jgi:bacillithiol synthase
LTNCRKLSFKDISSTSKLFADFLYDFDNKVAPYYCANFKNIERFKINASNISKRTYHRSELIDILTKQNKVYGLGEKTFANIDKLSDRRTCVVFTGQQVGLLTGPLYTIYKTITTIKLAEFLESEMGVPVVPIFWMAADDHDFEEIRHIHLIDQSNKISKFYYDPNEMPNHVPLGFLNFDENITRFNEQALSAINQTEYCDEIVKMVKDTYKPGMSICDAFGKLMGRLYSESGVIIVNPADVNIKKLAAPIFKKEIEDYKSSNQIIQLANVELGKLGYHTQVNRLENYLNLFYFTGRRSRIGVDGDMYFIDGVDKKHTQEELLELVDQSPNYFSPNVLLRPVMQDYIFPTLAYIGGPSEVAYFAQIKDLHTHFGVQCPIVYPRMSATILDRYSIKTYEKYGLNHADLIDDKTTQATIKSIIKNYIPNGLNDRLENDRQEIVEKIMQIEGLLQGLDEGVKKTVQKSRGKVEYELKSLQEKIIKAYKKQNDGIVDSVARTADFLFPESSMQERHLNVVTFLNKYGMGFIERISDNLKLDVYDHQVLCLEELGY